MPTAVPTLDTEAALVCASCGRRFTLADALQPDPAPILVATPAPVPVGPRRRRGRGVAVLAALIVLVALAAWLTSPDVAAERQALRAYCAPLATIDAGYPRAVPRIRDRAWMASSHSQTEGPAPFISLPDPRLGGATTIPGDRLRELLAPLRGHAWIPRLAVWVAGSRRDEVEQGGLDRAALVARGIPHATVEEFGGRLRAELGDDAATQAVLDLLSGTPGADAQALGRRMLAEGEFPDRLVLRPFSGDGGTRLIDQGRPPYASVTSDYAGLLLRCVGAGWPDGYRILTLRAGKG